MELSKEAIVSEREFLSDLVDLNKYPICSSDSSDYEGMVEDCRRELHRSGYFLFPGFIKKESQEKISSQCERLIGQAYHNVLEGNAYLTPLDENLPDSDPRNKIDTTSLAVVANDQIPNTDLVSRLYLCEHFLSLVASCLEFPKLYRYSDPLSSLNLAVMREGDHLRWHFDQSDYVVSLMIDNCHTGGKYEVVPGIRTEIDENYAAVEKILHGSSEGVITLDIEPGCLVLFQGKYSIHRVTKVIGDNPRVIALFSFDTKPDTVSSEYLKMIRYGRVN